MFSLFDCSIVLVIAAGETGKQLSQGVFSVDSSSELLDSLSSREQHAYSPELFKSFASYSKRLRASGSVDIMS